MTKLSKLTKDEKKQYLIETLIKCDGNISETARKMDLGRTLVHKWINQYRLQSLVAEIRYRSVIIKNNDDNDNDDIISNYG